MRFGPLRADNVSAPPLIGRAAIGRAAVGVRGVASNFCDGGAVSEYGIFFGAASDLVSLEAGPERNIAWGREECCPLQNLWVHRVPRCEILMLRISKLGSLEI